MLRYDHKAETWLTFVKKNNPGCGYKIDLPDQTAHPTEIDVENIVFCGAAPGPREFQATVQFQYDPAAGRWVLSRFSS